MPDARRLLGHPRLLALALLMAAAACSEAKPPVPLVAPRLVERSFFGMHLHWQDTGTPVRLPPVGAIRLWDTRTNWSHLQPTAGSAFDFSRLDKFVTLGQTLGADVMMTLGGTPQWAALKPSIPGAYGPGTSSPPRSMSEWDDYVRAVASRYRGRIKIYEVINEPSLMVPNENCEERRSFYCTTADDLVRMVDHTRAVILAVDPGATVTSPGFVHAWRMRDYLAAGGGLGARALDTHIYPPPSSAGQAKAFREIRAVLAAKRKSWVPLWNSEAGIPLLDNGFEPGERKIEEDDGPGAISRFLVLSAASRFDRVYYYAWDNFKYGLSTDGGTRPTRAGAAYLKTMSWLLGMRIFPCATEGNLWSCQLLDGTRRATIVWTDDGQPTSFALSGSTNYRHTLDGRSTRLGEATAVAVAREPVLISHDAPTWGRPLAFRNVGVRAGGE